MISVLIPSHCSNYEAQLAGILQRGTVSSFDSLVIEFLDAFSKSVLLDESKRPLPEMAAVAHWMRKAHTLKLRAAFEEMRKDRIWVPRGIALHFAPANVDSIFLYSWFLSMLAGNANIVRLSQTRNEQVSLLLAKLDLLLQQERFGVIRDRSLILSYPHDDVLTQRLSEACHLRVLWGGDESVRRLRAVPMNPLASDIVFPNRFSLALLNAQELRQLDPEQLEKLAARFCNDAYWFDQMACSSPRLVVWVGSYADCEAAQNLFWMEVEKQLAKRDLQYPEVVGINKLVSAYVAAGTGFADKVDSDISGRITRVHLADHASPEFRQIECGGGLFFEQELRELHDLVSLLNEKDQTLSYFGFKHIELYQLATSLPMRAIDRIVPIGAALDFSAVWDGNNLLQSFSREIDVK
jgi:hypothetical protein